MRSIAPIFAFLAAVHCNKDDKDTAATGQCAMTFTEANDYSYTASLALASTPLASLTDDTIDWSQLTVDYRGRPIDPTDVDQVTYVKLPFDEATILTKIETDTLVQADVGDYRVCATTGQTSVHLSDCAILGNYFDPTADFAQSTSFTWLATIWKENDRDQMEILSSQFMVPTDGDPNTTLTFENTSANLSFTVDLHTPAPIATLADCDDWSLDWSAVHQDVNGATFDPNLGDTLRLAHLPVATLGEVESQFLQLDIAADQTYFLPTYGVTSAPSLKAALTTDGVAFPGFTTDGIWLAGIECTALTCFSPAPKILAVVDVE